MNQRPNILFFFADSSIRFVEEWGGAKPFFVYTSLMAPHDSRSMPCRVSMIRDFKVYTR